MIKYWLQVHITLLGKLGLSLVLLFSFIGSVHAQRKYGNEWINYSQTYYKLKVVQNGIYRLSYADLQAAGVNVSTLDPTHLQLFFRGAETPIYVSSGSKTSLGSGDYIEFYGQGNDGALDSVLYLNPKDDINKSYSMYTDTAAYFLTVGSSASNMRYTFSAKKYGNNPQSTYTCEQDLNLHNGYYDGVPISSALNFTGSDYTSGEGWMGTAITCTSYGSPKSVSYNIGLTTNSLPTDTIGLPKPTLEMLVYGKSDVANQSPDHHLIILRQPGNVKIFDTTYDGFETIHRTLTRNWSDIIGKTQVTYTVESAGVAPTSGTGTSDENVVSFLRLRYPDPFGIDPNNPYLAFNFFNKSGAAQTDFDFTSATNPSAMRNLVLYDLTNHIRTKSFSMSGKSATFGIENYKTASNYVLYDTSQALKVLSINTVNFVKPNYAQNYNYIIITNKKFAQGAQAFATYKETQLIDSVNYFKPLIAYSSDLYDQFFYGVHHPAAIQNFMAYLYNNASQKPQYLLLLGKGIDNSNVRNYFSSDNVPSIGYPPADVMFTAGINIGFQGGDKVIDPKMGIGRLQILNNSDVLAYLDKLESYDSSLQEQRPYLKTAINVDGGDNDQILQIKNFMDAQANILSKPYTGLKVNSYYSVTNTAVNSDLQTAIQKNIEQGTGLFSYLAHGAAEQLQVNFADTVTLNNRGRYPIMYLNGCELGDASLNPNNTTYGGFYTLARNKGAIIWLCHSNLALDNVLYTEMGAFYKNIAVSNYGQSVGSTWRKSITDLKNFDADSEFRALLYEWTIQGDPSVRFPYFPKPDYAVFDSALFVSPPSVIASSASYQVAIPVKNLGKADLDSLKVVVRQTLPNQSVITFDTMMPPVSYLDTFYFSITRNNLNVQGINKFDVYVNADSAVDESSYANNHASFTYYFQGNGIRPLFPTDYYIVNTDTPALISQSRNLQDYKTGIYFEIDTTTRFDSPLKQTSPLLTGSSLITWHPKLNNTDGTGKQIDSTVYYWRTRMNLPTDTGGEWNVQSFIYLKNGRPGWSQSNWGQYNNIVPHNIDMDTISRKMSYPPKYLGYTLNMTPFNKNGIGIKADNSLILTNRPGHATLAFVEVDKNTLQPITYNRLTGQPLHDNVGPLSFQEFDMTNAAYRDTFVMAINAVPNGNYIMLTSFPDIGTGLQEIYDFEPSVLQAFAKIGDTLMNYLHGIHRDSLAYVMAGVKGSSKGTLLAEAYKFAKYPGGAGDTAMIHPILKGTIVDSGNITSQEIGPATQWNEMYQNYRSLEHPTSDQAHINVLGIDKNGAQTVLYPSVKVDSFDLSKINAQKYPYLKLQAFLSDTMDWTPPQLRLWQVEYNGIPEGTLVSDSQTIFPKSKYSQGDSIHLKIKFQNISDEPMTKVLVVFNIIDARNGTKVNDSLYYPPLNPGEFFWIDKYFPLTGLSGTNFLNVFVNPGFQQPEQTLDNNFIDLPFAVTDDNINPIMDVTFDGDHIADGQIVSPNPEIIASVRDENKYLILNDTSDYKISLQYPDSVIPDQIYFNNPKVKFFPGEDSLNNNSVINYHPGPLPDGTYLFSIQATDVVGNQSGSIPYFVHFKVINQPAVSNFYLYPNPLTNVSRFGFTITGNEIPQMVEIKIFDITGRCVRTFNLSGSGNLRAGVNEISWDGTDANGAVLNQGLYFYKTIVKLNGAQPQNYPLPVDGQLQQGFGKIIIMREP